MEPLTIVFVLIVLLIVFLFSYWLGIWWYENDQRKRQEWLAYQERQRIAYEQEQQKLLSIFHKGGISQSIKDYTVEDAHHHRGHPLERQFRLKHQNYLCSLFDNRCAACGNDENGLDIDHYFFPKSSGGMFMMLHKKGYFINNAVPLCETCNRSKGKKRIFRDYDLLIADRITTMTKRLNGWL